MAHHEEGKSGRGNPQNAPIAVEKYLKGVDCPATKDDLLEHAQDSGAPEDVLDIIEQMDDRDYESPVDVSKEVAKVHRSAA